jgi:hypothetical protein
MTTGQVITLIGFSIIFFYSIAQILNFYGIDSSVYGTYMFFYASMILTYLVLPRDDPE